MSAKRRDGTGTVYRRGKLYWVAYRLSTGERIHESAQTGDERAARSYLAARLREVRDGTWQPARVRNETPRSERTFADDWADWMATRDDVISRDLDASMGTVHFLPVFGEMRTAEITTAHILDWLATMRRKPSSARPGQTLSKNTIRNVNGRLVTFFSDMEQRGVVTRTPYAGLRKAQRPKAPTRHELTSAKRVFSIDEVQRLIFDERVPMDRRVLYAITYFSGDRIGEACGHQWSDWETTHEPLGMLRIERQYEGLPLKGKRGEAGPPRQAPVHPQFASILSAWKLSGFSMYMGRRPRPTDYIVPTTDGRPRSLDSVAPRLMIDCKTVGITSPTSQTHAFRRGMKTHACANGAAEVWIERVLHNASGNVASGYLADDWKAMCSAIECIPVSAPKLATVTPLRTGSVVTPVVTEATNRQEKTGTGEYWCEASNGDSEGFGRIRPTSTTPTTPQDRGETMGPMQSVTHVTTLREIAVEMRAAGRVDHARAVQWALEALALAGSNDDTSKPAPVERRYEVEDGRVVVEDAKTVASQPTIDAPWNAPTSRPVS